MAKNALVETQNMDQFGAGSLAQLAGNSSANGVLAGFVTAADQENKVRSAYPYHRLRGVFELVTKNAEGAEVTGRTRVAVIPGHLEAAVVEALESAQGVDFVIALEGKRARFLVPPTPREGILDTLWASLRKKAS